MHSGYHFIDLMQYLVSINLQLKEKQPDTINVFNQILRPLDHYEVFNKSDYEKLLGPGDYTLPSNMHGEEDFKTYGELDSYSQLQFLRNGKSVTTVQLSLMQSGFSQRAWAELPKDTYKSNGRIRHESVNIHVGPLYNIQVHSYQAAQIKEEFAQEETIGGKDHFDIYIFKNSNLIGGKPFELIEFGRKYRQSNETSKDYLGQNEQPRHQIVDELLDNLPSNSEIETHLTTCALMSAFCINHAKKQYGSIPFESYRFEDLFYSLPKKI
jgi:hypothetical protein